MTLLLLHGFCGGPGAWREVERQLGAARTRLVPALGGHHNAPVPASFEAEVDRLADLLRAFGPATVCGYSLGGRLALGIFDRHPELVERLILVGAHPGLATDEQRSARLEEDEAWARRLEDEGLASFVARWDAQPLFTTRSTLPPPAREVQHIVRAQHDPKHLAAALRAFSLAKMPDYWGRLERAAVPIDYIAGERDGKFIAVGRRIAAVAPKVRLVTIEDVGHDVVLERPLALADVIMASPGS